MTPLETALDRLEHGFWPVMIYPRGFIRGDKPVEGKEPFGPAWGAVRKTKDQLQSDARSFSRKGFEPGVGLCLGPGRAPGGEWLFDVEGDGPEAEASRAKLFDGEPIDSMGWNSTRGGHTLLIGDGDRLKRIATGLKSFQVKNAGTHPGVFKIPEFPDLEFRIGGFHEDGTVKQLQSVIPPTPGTDGTPRLWNDVESVAHAPDAFYANLETIIEEAQVKPAPKQKAKLNVKEFIDDEWTPERRAIAYLEACAPAISGNYGHDQAFGVAIGLGPGFDLSPEVAKHLFLEIYNPICEPPWSLAEIDRKVSEAYRIETRRGWKLAEDRNGYKHHEKNGRYHRGDAEQVSIEISTKRHESLDETLAVLPSDSDLYIRGNMLVRITKEVEDTVRLSGGIKLRQASGMPRVVIMGESGLSCRLTSLARFYSLRTIKDGDDVERNVHPPGWLVKAVLEHNEYPGIRPLLGMAETPFPRSDGTFVTRAGYDRETGVYLAPSVLIPDLPKTPTQEDANKAAIFLLELVEQFPFVFQDDQAVWLASLLTVIARPGIDGPVPGVAFNGNKAGTGKGKVIDCISVIANGRPVPCTSYPRDDAEATKLKTALALAATQIVHLDNLGEGRSYGGGVLDSAITSLTVSERILGVSKTTEGLELRCVWFLSGNNITPKKDAFRRWLVCNLVTDLERPEERLDLKIPDLLAYTKERRSEFVQAALTILKAHAIAGQPTGDWAPLGSFEQWDRTVRGAVWFATGFDCNATRRKAAEESPERVAKLALLNAWKELPEGGPSGRGVTAAQAKAYTIETNEIGTSLRYPELVEALEELGRDKKITPSMIGYIVRGMKGQNIGNLSFGMYSSDKIGTYWRVNELS